MKFLALSLVAALAACTSIDVPEAPPPLAAMEEPLELMPEPQDESARAALPKGSFTGLVVGDSRTSLDALAGEPEGVIVTSVVENSPADAAGLEVGDLVLEARAAQATALHWPSEWRRIDVSFWQMVKKCREMLSSISCNCRSSSSFCIFFSILKSVHIAFTIKPK